MQIIRDIAALAAVLLFGFVVSLLLAALSTPVPV